jgi:hypothetical protein
MLTGNGNGTASPQVERGASLAHRKSSKPQRAVAAANIYDGLTVYQPTQRELAGIYGVSVSLINRARQLSPERRKAIVQGRIGLPPLPATRLALPAPKHVEKMGEADLVNLVRRIGVNRVLEAAVAVEAAE